MSELIRAEASASEETQSPLPAGLGQAAPHWPRLNDCDIPSARPCPETATTRAPVQALRLRREVFQSKRIARLRDRLLSRGPRGLSERPAPGITPESRAAYQRIRPLAEAMYLVMAVDRRVSEVEQDALRGAIRMLTDGELGTQATENMITEFEHALASDGIEVRLDAVASALYGDRDDMELAIALAAAVAVADTDLDPAEQHTIEALAERLGISGRRLEKLLAGERKEG